MTTPFEDVVAFHKKHGINYEGKPRSLGFELLQFRLKFLREELHEFEENADALIFRVDAGVTDRDDEAEVTEHLASCLDALCDLVYVALGTAHLMGLPFNEAWDRVHVANMAKTLGDKERDFESRLKLKMEKPEGWRPPDHKDLVEDNSHAR